MQKGKSCLAPLKKWHQNHLSIYLNDFKTWRLKAESNFGSLAECVYKSSAVDFIIAAKLTNLLTWYHSF